jgi:hypothetical protein
LGEPPNCTHSQAIALGHRQIDSFFSLSLLLYRLITEFYYLFF